MEDGPGAAQLYREAHYCVYKIRCSINAKSYKDALLNLYKAKRWCDFLSSIDPEFDAQGFPKDVEKIESELKKVALKDKVDLEFLLNSLNLDMSPNLVLNSHYYRALP
jgi:hypothetical protein